MEQLTQNLKDGTMQILEVPYPALSSGQVLVRNHYSLISSGTEGKTVKDARLGYIGKARARKEEVKKVFDAARTFGVMNTYRMVMNKLDAPSSLGYSCAGEVIAVAEDVSIFRVGDMVACGGASAVHAEVVAVPVNLCVRLLSEVDAAAGAFTTVGAIALQGIRQADLRLGENCVVIGLGLVGQLTIQMLRAAGVKVAGIDIDDQMINKARLGGCELVMNRNQPGIEESVLEFTDGYGTDAVIITAGADSTDPVDLAGALCRKKGKVIIVGGVPTGFKRPNYFKKELDLRMSSSYGPGRYDLEYEENGIDYPYGYVRWTENRNMQAFVEMVDSGRLNIRELITHTFDFKDAHKAYELVLKRTESFVGIVLRYDTNKELKRSVVVNPEKEFNPADANIGLIGAGSFGQNFLLPALKGKANFISVATARPNNAVNIATKHGFINSTGDSEELINNEKVNTIFIATRHNTHASLVKSSLERNKNVFVEKPLCLTRDELKDIADTYATKNAKLMVGFNRRFAPFTKKLMQSLPVDTPRSIVYRINAGIIPADHWVHNPAIGGGRIIGELCHFIDLAMHIAGSNIKSISAQAIRDGKDLHDTLVVNIQFENGSIAGINYFSNGNKALSKEYLEVFSGGVAVIIDDFKTLTIHSGKSSKESGDQDKGHNHEVEEFLNSIKNGTPSPIPFNELIITTLATFGVLESIARSGEKIDISIENLIENNSGN